MLYRLVDRLILQRAFDTTRLGGLLYPIDPNLSKKELRELHISRPTLNRILDYSRTNVDYYWTVDRFYFLEFIHGAFRFVLMALLLPLSGYLIFSLLPSFREYTSFGESIVNNLLSNPVFNGMTNLLAGFFLVLFLFFLSTRIYNLRIKHFEKLFAVGYKKALVWKYQNFAPKLLSDYKKIPNRKIQQSLDKKIDELIYESTKASVLGDPNNLGKRAVIEGLLLSDEISRRNKIDWENCSNSEKLLEKILLPKDDSTEAIFEGFSLDTLKDVYGVEYCI